ncbi:hypothetical protein EGW35_02980 [Enterococcus durans]|nr:hypothetical protein CUM72_12715 [Enterococcus durans]ROX84639.1 hypothetical protein EGW35_02980 [Enterococcus durans]TKN17075.1 hypothetical protein DVW83_09035 [Enterococcus sp. VV15]
MGISFQIFVDFDSFSRELLLFLPSTRVESVRQKCSLLLFTLFFWWGTFSFQWSLNKRRRLLFVKIIVLIVNELRNIG